MLLLLLMMMMMMMTRIRKILIVILSILTYRKNRKNDTKTNTVTMKIKMATGKRYSRKRTGNMMRIKVRVTESLSGSRDDS